MLFPEYVEIEISSRERDIITELPKELKKSKRGKGINKEK
jgi:hypothetical protein